MIELEKLLDLAGTFAQKALIERGHRQLLPTFLFVTDGGEATLIGCPWQNDFEKQLMVAGVRLTLRDAGARRYSFITEAWFAPAPKDAPIEEVKKMRASLRPDRQEGVIAFATDGVTTKWRQWSIKRDWKGQIRELPDRPIGKEDQLMSPFTNLLGGTA